MNKYFSNLKSDIPASIVVFFVAVPLCLGIALASGAPLISGLLAGAIGGIVVGLFSGSQIGVSGPAAGLVAIVLTAIEDLGSFEAFLVAVLIAGILQIIFGLLRGGLIAYFFPTSVIKGMLSAIGIIIIIKQIPHLFGYDGDFLGDTNFFQPDGENTFSELLKMIDYINPAAIIVAFVSIIVLVVWEKYVQHLHTFFKILQGPIVVVILGILANLFFASSNLGFQFRPEEIVTIPDLTSLSKISDAIYFPDFSAIGNKITWIAALTIAVVASLETLLCVEATDKLDPLKRITPTNKELIAQGIGNTIAGLIGALPITQVIVRSSANVAFGGKTKVSAIFHGVLIILSLLFFKDIINKIPYASLAAILVIVGYKLAKPTVFKAMLKLGHAQYVPFLTTVFAIVFTDLLIGIGIGLVVALIYILRDHMKNNFEVVKKDNQFEIILSEEMSFLNKASLRKELMNIPNDSEVVLNYQKSKVIHPDIDDIIEDFKESSKERNINVTIKKN
ncbi:MAG: SulP family inorganic anion transporter [Vicingaceae bacterium]